MGKSERYLALNWRSLFWNYMYFSTSSHNSIFLALEYTRSPNFNKEINQKKKKKQTKKSQLEYCPTFVIENTSQVCIMDFF